MAFCSVPLFPSNSYAGVKIPSDLTVNQHPSYSEIHAFLSPVGMTIKEKEEHDSRKHSKVEMIQQEVAECSCESWRCP